MPMDTWHVEQRKYVVLVFPDMTERSTSWAHLCLRMSVAPDFCRCLGGFFPAFLRSRSFLRFSLSAISAALVAVGRMRQRQVGYAPGLPPARALGLPALQQAPEKAAKAI